MIDIDAILGKVASHAAASGYFERVNLHEPKNSPNNGLSCAVWLDAITPVPTHSGLRATTGRVAFMVRVYTNMLSEPPDFIDPTILKSVEHLMGAYSGDFELGGTVRNVDLLGMAGAPLQAQAGYLNQDGKLLRVMTITLPLIINDIWEQSP